MIFNNETVERLCPSCKNSKDNPIVYTSSKKKSNNLNNSFSPRGLPNNSFFQYLKCLRCDTLYSSPTLKEDMIDCLYEKSTFDTAVEAEFAAKSYLKTFESVILEKNKCSKVIDIGSSNGAFLHLLYDLGLTNLVGVEPSKSFQDIKIPFTKHSTFEPTNYSVNSIDLITIFQTLEHLYHPKKTLDIAYKVLKDDGHIILVTHNYRSLPSKILNNHSPLLDPQHLQLFSNRSIKYILKACGFKNIKVFDYYNTYPLYYWLKLLPPSFKSKEKLIKALQKTRFGNKVIGLKAGNLGIIASK